MSDKSLWIPVGELAEGFAPEANTLPASDALIGKSFDLHFSNGQIIEHRFVEIDRLVWTITTGEDSGQMVEEEYHASELRDGYYFVDFIKSGERATSVSLVLDINNHVFTTVIGQMPTEAETRKTLAERVAAGEELTPVNATFLHGTINTPYSDGASLHQTSTELLGKRVFYQYSPTEEYEHIYLNSNIYTWHCIIGVEAGLGDTERCHHYKIADDLYLFVWREKIIPTLGIIMIDLQRGKTTGKIMGYAGDDFGELSNFRVGAFARVLNATNYRE